MAITKLGNQIQYLVPRGEMSPEQAAAQEAITKAEKAKRWKALGLGMTTGAAAGAGLHAAIARIAKAVPSARGLRQGAVIGSLFGGAIGSSLSKD
jgi:hypothetical protein